MHRCTGRQTSTSSFCALRQSKSAMTSTARTLLKPESFQTETMHRHIAPAIKIARICFMRFPAKVFLRSTVLIFSSSLATMQASNSSIIVLDRKLRNYLPKAIRPETMMFVFTILLIHVCYSASAGLHHFCAALMVAHKLRLCLHPRGMLRVQSLHLPLRGLGSAFSALLI